MAANQITRSYPKAQAEALALVLINESAEFTVSPCPYDVYELTVKDEHARYLRPAAGYSNLPLDEFMALVHGLFIKRGLSYPANDVSVFQDYFLRLLSPTQAVTMYLSDEEDA